MLDDLYLMGDEDCGVGLYCREHWDGGQPLAYYYSVEGYPSPYANRPEVEDVTTVAGLMAAAERHAQTHA